MFKRLYYSKIPLKTSVMQSLAQADREPRSLDLQFVDGYTTQDLPTDIHGHVFINSAVGTVNSGGLPIPKYLPHQPGEKRKENPEYGSPFLTGDGKIIRLDFDRAAEGIVHYQSKVLVPPDLYADEATAWNGPARQDFRYRHMGFTNHGFGRLSMKLGSRNQLNTAIVPVRYAPDDQVRLLATIDAGRPYEFDPVKLEVTEPVGKLTDWSSTLPHLIEKAFPTVFGCAHPVFDPHTYDFFLVNFVRSLRNMIITSLFSRAVERHPEYVHRELKHFNEHELKPEQDFEGRMQQLEQFYSSIEQRIRKHQTPQEKLNSLWDQWLRWLEKLVKRIDQDLHNPDRVYLMHWNGLEGKMKKWRVVDEAGKDLNIDQIMHQISLSEDYLILMDSSFKFTFDQAFSFPLETPGWLAQEIDREVRKHTTTRILPYTHTYLVKRSDLGEGETVQARRITLDHSTLHFNADYANPEGRVTLYTANNTANCASEWIRPYDALVGPDPSQPPQPLDEEWIGSFAIGNMDVCTIGRYVLDYEKGEVDQERTQLMHEVGDVSQLGQPGGSEKVGPHTWAVALHTYRDIISPYTVGKNVKNIYWQNQGLYPQTLTRFIYDLYEDYAEHRIVPADKVAAYSSERMPGVLVRTQTSDMSIQDHYLMPLTAFMRSIQFVPRRRDTPPGPEVDLSQDGYLVMTMVVKLKETGDKKYQAQVWIFDAADLDQGPICKLYHPDVTFNYPLHSTWLPELVSPTPPHHIDVEADYNEMIRQTTFWPGPRARLQGFFQQYVYPHYRKS